MTDNFNQKTKFNLSLSNLIGQSRSSFTLIELLVVLALVAILSVVVVMTLNPAELLKQARDSNRLSDIATINTSLNLFAADVTGGFMGTSTIVYISIPDTSPTCVNLGLPTSTTFIYNCATTANLRNTDGTGWIPVNLQRISSNSPISQLPVDPINTTSSGNYYTYVTGGSWILTAIPESQKQKLELSNNPHLAKYPGVIGIGSNLDISPLYNPNGLVGYWKFEGDIKDYSGSGNNGTWYGTSTFRYVSGKVGVSAGYFNGTSDYIDTGNSSITNVIPGNFSISVWVKNNQLGITKGIMQRGDGAGITTSKGFQMYLGQSGAYWMNSVWDGTNGHQVSAGGSIPADTGIWHNLAFSFTSSTKNIDFYIDGILRQSTSNTLFSTPDLTTQSLYLGSFNAGGGPFFGLLDDVRIYNRALSTAEILAIYNATK